MGYYDNKRFWFGTREYMQWIDTPKAGAAVSPTGWSTGGTLINGGAFQLNSFGHHKRYVFEWKASTSADTAGILQAYSEGAYGKGLIHFLTPESYERNILPAKWANPSLALDYEATPHVLGADPAPAPVADWRTNQIPSRGVTYDLTSLPAGAEIRRDTGVFVPIPEGYAVILGAMYAYTGSARLFYQMVDGTGAYSGSPTAITPMPTDGTTLHNISLVSGQARGVQIWPSYTTPGDTNASLSLFAMSARTVKYPGTIPPNFNSGPWHPGMGNSGCRFVGKPEVNLTGPLGGYQVAVAASFVEVGDTVRG